MYFHFVCMQKSKGNEMYSLFGIEKHEDDCVSCEEGSYYLSVIDHDKNSQIRFQCLKLGGDFMSLQQRDEDLNVFLKNTKDFENFTSRITFDPLHMISEEGGSADLVKKYFPSIAKKTHSVSLLAKCTIVIGNMILPALQWDSMGIPYDKFSTEILPDQAKRKDYCLCTGSIQNLFQQKSNYNGFSTHSIGSHQPGEWLSIKKK